MQPSDFNNLDNPAYLFVDRPQGEPIAMALEVNNSLFAGSGSNCKIVLEGNIVQPIHCMFWMNEKRVVRVQDWNTEVGISVNGQTVSAETVLNSGDELDIGGNRIVLVLSRDVHQRISDHFANPEILTERTNDPSANGPSIPSTEPVELTDEVVVELSVDTDLDSLIVESEAENHESSPSEFTGYQYDVLADLDEVEMDEGDLTSPFRAEVSGFEGSGGFNELDNEELELLRIEVDQLRFELAEHDAQLVSDGERNGDAEPDSEENDQTAQLVNRLEDLLEELQASDDRVRGLEDMLRASDQATQAERDERQQLESWVTEIEQRVAERESESEAELGRVKNRLVETVARHKQTQVQLKKVLQFQGGAPGNNSSDLISKFREQIEDLEKNLEASRQENDQFLRQGSGSDQEAEAQEAFRQMEQKLLQQQVETSRERAEMSRQRAELERLKGELESKLRTEKNTGNGDAQLREMRQHLREIHEEEKLEREEKRQRSLGGRISRLLGSSSR